MEYDKKLFKDIVHLSRLALSGRQQDIKLFIHRFSRKINNYDPNVSNQLITLLKDTPSQKAPIRNVEMPNLPVDRDSRLNLMKFEYPIQLDIEPIWSDNIINAFGQIIHERHKIEDLLLAGLLPTRSLMFFGKPGVGKTLGARWLAEQLNLPLFIIDLSAVMSSFLGRTGNNIRNVFDYAKNAPCILLLDELDAIAKRRDDVTDIGELKRLVTVLLQEIDDWPPDSLLLSATNHPKLLDPAVWRRFDMTIEFPMPNTAQIEQAIKIFLANNKLEDNNWYKILKVLFKKASFSEIERDLLRLRRKSVIMNLSLEELILDWARENIQNLSSKEKIECALNIYNSGCSQRKTSEITGVSRDTIRKACKKTA